MTEPLSPSILGVKYASLAAGFAGGVVSLSFIVGLTRAQMVAAVLTGTLSAGYLTPLMVEVASQWFRVSQNLESAAGFFVGLCAMNIIPGLLALSRRFKDNPAGIVRGDK